MKPIKTRGPVTESRLPSKSPAAAGRAQRSDADNGAGGRTGRTAFAAAILIATVGLTIQALSSLRTAAFTDYEVEAQPAVEALRALRLAEFVELAPTYFGSILFRAPFLVLSGPLGGGLDGAYRALALPGLLALGTAGLGLWSLLHRAGRPRAGWLALAICCSSPLSATAIEMGHAEELLGAALLLAAIGAALSDRGLLCGVLLGLTVANKAWGALAVVPVLMILRRDQLRALLACCVSAGLVLAPVMLASSAATSRLQAVAHQSGPIFSPWQAWWFLGEHRGDIVTGSELKIGYRTPPDWIASVSHPAVIGVPLLLALALYLARRRSGSAVSVEDALLLTCLTFLLRGLLDSWNIHYYLLTLLAWELRCRTRLPVLASATALLLPLTMIQTRKWLSADAQAALFLAWTAPLAVWMMVSLWAPQRTRHATARISAFADRAMPALTALARSDHPQCPADTPGGISPTRSL